ncbi:GNAT family N-acetyltransferase [Methylobacterium platani]|uniref:GCN5 family acetyltransferase n=2 Tax=Methylobacterium platani TaxID=427683 RepID=A0A179SHZ8_9HYPH|nr:GNAT family N-acetyltransferase [Methylobacterium platani]KMO17039.1 GCN5 family acetyltransferase [Methylobacterium platani JCM 14648]OAS26531.1 GCN5 family acetyltransferase [Methylobacterium platani]
MALSAPEPLCASHETAAFSCGKPALDRWLKTRALSNQEKGFTAVMVVHEARRVIGYYGLAPTAVVPDILPRAIRTGQPPDPVPCLLLGQLATDTGWAGRGIGKGLLKHALGRCVKAAALVGGRAVMVHAVDDEAVAFWQRWGFVATRNSEHELVRSIADIAASFTAPRT